MTPFEQAIASLGTTHEEISNTLREKGIKGYRRSACACPIAKYLKACGFPNVGVSTYACRYPSAAHMPDLADEFISLPLVIRNWIEDFDKGGCEEFLTS